MFTWECSKCGREVDIAEETCPHCEEADKKVAAKTTEARPVESGISQPPASRLPEPTRSDHAVSSNEPRSAMSIRPGQLALVVVVMLVAVLGAVYVAEPSLFQFGGGAETEGEIQAAVPPGVGSIEIAGVRTWYNDDYEPQVRALVINHGEDPQQNVDLRVMLRPRAAPPDSPPLALFDVRITDGLPALASKEIETSLEASGTLASFPDWSELQLEVSER